MADEWYYLRDGDEFGPVPAARLKQLASAGQLQPTDLVWKVGMEKKVPARTVKGLFSDSGVSPPGRPAADSRIQPPPGRRAGRDDIAPVDPISDEEAAEPTRRSSGKQKGGVSIVVWLLLGGGVFLFCCVGTPIGGWFAWKSMFGGPRFNTENAKKIKVGMSEKEVTEIVGPGRLVNEMKGKESLRTLEWDDGLGMKMQMTFVNDKLLIAPIIPDFKFDLF